MSELLKRLGSQDRKERGFYVVRAAQIPDETLGMQIFHRIGDGFETGDEALNPQTVQSTYINGKSSSTTIGFQESWGISGERFVGDYSNDMFADMAERRAKGPEAKVIMLTVNFFEELMAEKDDPSDPDEGAGIFRAFRQTASYSPESGGGGGGTDSVMISGTLNGSGTPTEGWFRPLATFYDDPTTTLTADSQPEDWGVFHTNPNVLLALDSILGKDFDFLGAIANGAIPAALHDLTTDTAVQGELSLMEAAWVSAFDAPAISDDLVGVAKGLEPAADTLTYTFDVPIVLQILINHCSNVTMAGQLTTMRVNASTVFDVGLTLDLTAEETA